MNITIKESMLIRKCLGHYVSSQLLDFDKSPLFNDLIHKLKEFESDNIKGVYVRKAIEEEAKINPNETNVHNAMNQARISQNKDNRKALNKELRKYNYQTICNKKVLELIKEERITPFKATIKEIKTIDHRKEKKAITQELVNDIVSKLNLDVANKINERERKREGEEAMKSLIKLNLDKKGGK
tara:strand:- start:161 stop:712 length:552 start_codon:yes stop_codon:yes gene_type:complete